jgi:membrane associated rhomboid family serine protease
MDGAAARENLVIGVDKLDVPRSLRAVLRVSPMRDESSEPVDASEDSARLRAAFVLSGSFAILLWLVKIFESVTGFDPVRYGIYPRTLSGLAGILLAPFVHSSPEHLLSNTLPIVILGTALLYGYPRSARVVIPVVFLGGGLAVWLFGRPSYHVGASGLIFGLMFFVATVGVLRWDRRAIGLALVVFFLYGAMVWQVLPVDPQVSFESHLAGAILGVTLAFCLRRLDAPAPQKRYSWEQQTADEGEVEQPTDGDWR